jgi:choline kinase
MPSALSSQSSGKLDPAQEDTDQAIKTDEDQQGNLFHQVSEWLQHEKVRRSTRKARRGEGVSNPSDGAAETAERSSGEQHRSSESTFSLDRLENILLQYANVGHSAVSRQTAKRVSRRRPKGLRRGSASESEYTDLEAPVPGVDASLDNSKTLAYSGGAGEEEVADSNSSSKGAKGREAWVTFKMENAGDIEVVRLSGAMTNAIYVVGPPKNQPPLTSSSSSSIVPRRPPP